MLWKIDVHPLDSRLFSLEFSVAAARFANRYDPDLGSAVGINGGPKLAVTMHSDPRIQFAGLDIRGQTERILRHRWIPETQIFLDIGSTVSPDLASTPNDLSPAVQQSPCGHGEPEEIDRPSKKIADFRPQKAIKLSSFERSSRKTTGIAARGWLLCIPDI
jgi:hypothetical protein